MAKEERGIEMENINYNKVNNILSVLQGLLSLFVQRVSVQGVYYMSLPGGGGATWFQLCPDVCVQK